MEPAPEAVEAGGKAYSYTQRTQLLSKVLLNDHSEDSTKYLNRHTSFLIHNGPFVVFIDSQGAHTIRAMSSFLRSSLARNSVSVVFCEAVAVQDLVFSEISHRAFV